MRGVSDLGVSSYLPWIFWPHSTWISWVTLSLKYFGRKCLWYEDSKLFCFVFSFSLFSFFPSSSSRLSRGVTLLLFLFEVTLGSPCFWFGSVRCLKGTCWLPISAARELHGHHHTCHTWALTHFVFLPPLPLKITCSCQVSGLLLCQFRVVSYCICSSHIFSC